MTSAFSFGFSGDDIDETEINDVNEGGAQEASAVSTLPELVTAQRHEISEWVSRSALQSHMPGRNLVDYQTSPE